MAETVVHVEVGPVVLEKLQIAMMELLDFWEWTS
jgi:hypothetical protein